MSDPTLLDHLRSDPSDSLAQRAADEIERLHGEVANLKETEHRLLEHIDAKTGDCVWDEQWDDMWQLVHPGDKSWEYPGQVIREVRHGFQQLQAENERLRSALGQYADERNWLPESTDDHDDDDRDLDQDWWQPTKHGYEIARQALGQKESE